MGEIKQAYIAELEQRLSDSLVEMRQLQVRFDKVNIDTGHDLYIEMQNLRQKRDDTKVKLQALREVDHENWDHMKEELEKAWQNINKLLQKIGNGLEHEWDTKA